MKARISKLTINGFKSIRKLDQFEPTTLNILIGPNGAGKSNFISFFRFLSWMLSDDLQEHIASQGGGQMLLHDGANVSREIEASIELDSSKRWEEYAFRLFYAAGDTLVFASEKFRVSRKNSHKRRSWKELGVGQKESVLATTSINESGETMRILLEKLRKVCVYQFHNTSLSSRMRAKWPVEDNRWLKEDAANIGTFLLRIRKNEPACYQKMISLLRLILPFFHDFVLEPDYDRVLLQWREKGSDVIFDASQASDGMLRTIALVALLAQPADQLPGVIVLDEPELGLHPYAIDTIAGLIKSASRHSQVFVATQSATLIDNFEPEDIVVVERQGRESIFKRQDSKSLAGWLKDYSISELWEKNVLGGRP